MHSASALLGCAATFILGVYFRSLILSYLGPVAWVLLMVFIRRQRQRRARLLVATNNGAVCWQCWYPLTGVESDRCPECGIPFDREALRLAWTKALYPR